MAQGELPYQENTQKSVIRFIQPDLQGNHKSLLAGSCSVWTLNVHFPATSKIEIQEQESMKESRGLFMPRKRWYIDQRWNRNTRKLWSFGFLQTHNTSVCSEGLVPSIHQTVFVEGLTLCRNKKHFQKSVLIDWSLLFSASPRTEAYLVPGDISRYCASGSISPVLKPT